MSQLPMHSDPSPNTHYVAEGLECLSPDSDRSCEGEYPPFMIFMPGPQDYLPAHFESRFEAELVANVLNEAAAVWFKTRITGALS